MLECRRHLFANEFLPLRGLDLGDQPVAHREQHYDGEEHGCRFHDLPTSRHRSQQRFQNDCGGETRNQAERDAKPDGAKSFAVSGLEQKCDDCSNDENRLESFAQNDQEGLEERFPAGRWLLGEIDHRGQAIGDRIAGVFRSRDVVPLHRSLEVGEVSFHGGDEAGLFGARRRLERLERDVCIERAVTSFGGLPGACKVECAVEQRENHR